MADGVEQGGTGLDAKGVVELVRDGDDEIGGGGGRSGGGRLKRPGRKGCRGELLWRQERILGRFFGTTNWKCTIRSNHVFLFYYLFLFCIFFFIFIFYFYFFFFSFSFFFFFFYLFNFFYFFIFRMKIFKINM